MNREKTGVNVARHLLCIYLFFNFVVFVNAVAFRFTFLNSDFWSSTIRNGASDEFYEDEVSRIDWEYLDDRNLVDDKKALVADMNDIIIDGMFNAAMTGDASVDQDVTDQLFDDHFEKNFKKEGYSSRQIKNARKDLHKAVENVFEGYKKDRKNNDFFNFLGMAYAVVLPAVLITLVMTAIVLAVLLAIHRNKMRPFVNILVSAFFALITSAGLWGLMHAILDEAASKEKDGDTALIKSFVGSLGWVPVIMFIGAAVCLAGALSLSRAAKRHDASFDDFDAKSAGITVPASYGASLTAGSYDTDDSDFAREKAEEEREYRRDYDDELE